MAHVEQAISSNRGTGVYPGNDILSLNSSGGPNTTYKDGDFVSIPGVGQLGVRIVGGQTFVNTRTNRYLVPSHLTTREEISAWVINAYHSGAISGRLYPMHTSQGAGQVAVGQPFTIASSPYSAVGFNRALSTMTDVARKGVEIALNKFPMAQRVLRLLDQFLPKSGPNGTSDVLRIEVNTNLNRPLKKCSSNSPGALISKKRVAQTRLRSDCDGQSGLFAGRLAHFGRTYPTAHA